MSIHPGETSRPLTWRIENVPEGTSHEDLISYFHRDDQKYLKVKSLCPSVETPEGEEGDLTGTLFFHPPEAVQRPPRIETDDMNIDKEFFGFTPLYVPPPGKGPILADIIAVTGLAGHAFGSWAHSHESMWLRDYLPKDVPNTRILTYGYPSKLQASTSISILQDHTNTFVHRLIDMRENAKCEIRPIIFVGHSLGCLIIKKALTGLENMGIARSRLPVRAFIFLGAPHRGLNVTALQTLVKGEPTAKLIAELEADSATLTDLNQGFAHVAKDIDILTCYETRSTKTAIKVDGVWKREGPPVMMVSPNSAQQYYLKEKGQNGIYPNVKSAIKHGLTSTAKIIAGADASLEPTTVIDKAFIKVQISEEPQLSPQPPPYSYNQSAGTTPRRPLATRAGSSSMTSSPPMADMRQESLIALEDESREINTRNLTHTSTATSTPNRAPSLPSVPKVQNFSNTSKMPIAGESSGDEKIAVFCDICNGDVTYDEFHYSCDDCAAAELEEASEGEDDEVSTDDKSDAEGNDNAVSKDDDTWDNSFDVCQKCFTSGLQGPEHAGHKFVKNMLVFYSHDDFAIFPYPERQVFIHDSNIVKALKEGDQTKLVAATRNGDNVNAYDTDGNTPLHLAIHLGLTVCAEILLNAGASREIRERGEKTPLHNAVSYNQVEILKILLEKGADINATCTDSETALHLAALNGQHGIVRILLEKGASVNILSAAGTPLLYAAMNGHTQTVRLLLGAGADLNLQAEDGAESEGKPLIAAAEAGEAETIRILVEYGARVEDRTAEGYTALLRAAAVGHLETYETLLRLGADSHAKTNDGRSALAIAAEGNQREMVEFLLKHGAKIDEPDNEGDTPLMLAMGANELEIGEFLLKLDAKVNIKNNEGLTPLMIATARNNLDTVMLLLKYGAEVDLPETTSGETPLMHAVVEEYVEVCEALLRHKSNIEQVNSAGNTPLMAAAMNGKLESVKLLLRYRPRLDRMPLFDGWNAITSAAHAGNFLVVKYLLEHGASAVPPSRFGKWKNFFFIDDVDLQTEYDILQILREYKHR